MKKIFAFIFTVVITTGVYAQSNKEDVDLIQAMYGKAKKELVAEFMAFKGDEGKSFWTVYDAFEAERKVIGRERIQIISDYADHYATLDNIKAGELGNKALANNIALEKLNQKYYPKFTEALGALKATKFMQLELYMQTSVKRAIQDRIPFIETLDNTRKEVK